MQLQRTSIVAKQSCAILTRIQPYHFYNPLRVPFSKSCDPRLARPKPDANRIIIESKKKNIPQSPWKMNFLVKLIRGAHLPDALAQLKFSPKHRALDVSKIVERAASLAKIKYDAIPEELVVKECIINKGIARKRARIMGRGRTGVGYKRSTHVTVKVEKVDFQKEILHAPNPLQQKKWMRWQALALKKRNLNGVISNNTTNATSDAGNSATPAGDSASATAV